MTQGMATSSFKNKLFISVNYVEGKNKTDFNSYLKAHGYQTSLFSEVLVFYKLCTHSVFTRQ